MTLTDLKETTTVWTVRSRINKSFTFFLVSRDEIVEILFQLKQGATEWSIFQQTKTSSGVLVRRRSK